MPLVVFVGDGVSDLAAAREADVLFARRGLRLEEYCRESKIPHISFDTFRDIQQEIIRIMKDDTKKTAGAGKPTHYNPRANFWRKAIKKKNVRYIPFWVCGEEWGGGGGGGQVGGRLLKERGRCGRSGG